MLKKMAITSAMLVLGGLFAATAGADTKTGTAAGSEYEADKQGMTQQDKQKQGPSFSELDENGDGTISQSEWQQAEVDVDHGSLDRDADGQVDRSEFAAFERTERDPTDRSERGTEHGTESTDSEYDDY